jgi:iron-sulfur cluster assembly protein
MITITAKALTEIKRLQTENKQTEEGLRVVVTSGGCSGLKYGLLFDNKKEGDHEQTEDGLKVLLDPETAVYMRGTTIDYKDGLDGKGFTFANPNATRGCGCGESFSV